MSARIDRSLIPAFPNLDFEQALWQNNFQSIAGLDEAGRGAWAGPVAAAAVILPNDSKIQQRLKGVRDSKELSAKKRSEFAPLIKQVAAAWGSGMCTSQEIDEIGILPATRLAMQRALDSICLTIDALLIDALFLSDNQLPQTALIKGDQRSLSIAAASILAKTARDAWMCEIDNVITGYAFTRHKGYGTALHQQLLARFGPCAIHRRSFAPIRAMLSKKSPVNKETGDLP